MASPRNHLLCALLLSGVLNVLGQMRVDISPSGKVIKNAGDEFSMICQVSSPLQSCNIVLGGKPYNLSPATSAPNIKYNGRGLQTGQCGINITRVEMKHNGIIQCSMSVATEVEALVGSLELVVTKSPNQPELKIVSPTPSNYKFTEGDIITASCTVKNGRPASKILWYLGDKQVVDGLSREQITATTLNDGEVETVQQNMTRRLEGSDNYKHLKCVAKHPALPANKNSTFIQLEVKYPPKSSGKTIEVFGLVLGAEGRVAVNASANPKPTFKWMIDGMEINEGKGMERFYVEQATQGSGFWQSVLVIDSLTKEDVSRKYYLVAKNNLGEAEFPVELFTGPEPRTADMGAGTIAAIVVAVFVVLLITVILVFARAKGRWCFAGGAMKGSEGPEKQPEGNDNPAANHNSSEYINTTPELKKPKEDTPV